MFRHKIFFRRPSVPVTLDIDTDKSTSTRAVEESWGIRLFSFILRVATLDLRPRLKPDPMVPTLKFKERTGDLMDHILGSIAWCRNSSLSRGAILVAILFLYGCVSAIPQAIRVAPANSPTVKAAREAAEKVVGTQVRWGGTIARIENKETETWLEVVDKELRSNGQPMETDQSQGRFIARVAGFLDPVIYEKGRHITVAGTLEKPVVSDIGEFTYLFPVVKVESHYLWEPKSEVVYRERLPYWYYDPWFPYRHPGFLHRAPFYWP